MQTKYKCTFAAALCGYICQAIVNMFAPLLFLTFQSEFDVSLGSIALLVSVNFCVQLAVDLLSAKFVDKIGYKKCAVVAHAFIVIGFVCLATLPFIMPPFAGLVVSVCVYAVGGGLLEVLVSPIVEALPTANKEGTMSFLHSFYCWGCIIVVGFSTLFFVLAGIEHWRLLAVIWAAVPLLNGIFFIFVPVGSLEEENGGSMPIRKLLSMKLIWLFLLLMVCAGAAEQSVSQWASTFAEAGLGISKTMGDVFGVCMFSLFMGIARALYAKLSKRIDVTVATAASGGLCVLSYLGMTLVPVPVFNLVCCAACGLSVGILWPAFFSIAARSCPKGGTAMFALIALAGDIGCASGPALVGFVSDAFGGALKWGILAAVVFPLALTTAVLLFIRSNRKKVRMLSGADTLGSGKDIL